MTVKYMGGTLYPDGSWRVECGVPGAWTASYRVTWDADEDYSHVTSDLVSVSCEEPDSGPLEAELRYAETISGYAESREDYLRELSLSHDPS